MLDLLTRLDRRINSLDKWLPPQQTVDPARAQRWAYLKAPTAAQREILESDARYQVVACGRRFGKTSLAVHKLGRAALRTGKRYGYFAPTYKLLADTWREMKTALGVLATKNEQEKRLTLVNGGGIDFWTLQNEYAARGRKYAGLVVDEAAWVPNLEAVWNEALRPTLSDYRGWALFLSTPRGRNFFWALYQRGVTGEDGWHSWRFPTAANPHIAAEEIEDARNSIPERSFRQEYLAEFVEDAGAVFRHLDAAATVEQRQSYNPAHDYVAGVDWGRHEDYTAVVVIDVTTRQVVAAERFNRIGWERQRGYIRKLAEQWRPYVIVAEANSMGEPNVEALQAGGLPIEPFWTTSRSKASLIESLALAIERGELALLKDEVLLGELQAYTMERLPSGGWRYTAPKGMHDDMVIALALAWRATNRGRVSFGEMVHIELPRGGW